MHARKREDVGYSAIIIFTRGEDVSESELDEFEPSQITLSNIRGEPVDIHVKLRSKSRNNLIVSVSLPKELSPNEVEACDVSARVGTKTLRVPLTLVQE